jgi:hypothetical protein
MINDLYEEPHTKKQSLRDGGNKKWPPPSFLCEFLGPPPHSSRWESKQPDEKNWKSRKGSFLYIRLFCIFFSIVDVLENYNNFARNNAAHKSANCKRRFIFLTVLWAIKKYQNFFGCLLVNAYSWSVQIINAVSFLMNSGAIIQINHNQFYNIYIRLRVGLWTPSALA